MKELLDRADYTNAKNYNAVRAAKKRDYLPIVQAWEQQQPQGDPVDWCLSQLQGKNGQPKPATTYHQLHWQHLVEGACEHGCKGAQSFLVKENGRDVGFTNCVCAGGTMSLQEQIPTKTQTKTATQNTDRDPIKELSKRLRAV
jgi:hypothetical protein